MKSSRLLILSTLFIASAVQAASEDESRMDGMATVLTTVPTPAPNQPVSESRAFDLGDGEGWGSRGGGKTRGDARYGTGYEARQGLGTQGGRGRRGR